MRGGTTTAIGWALLELLLLTPVSLVSAHRCDRTPEGHVAPKIPADNRFQLKISGSPDKYVPGEGYTISLQGLRNHGQVAAKFTGFMLVVEPQHHIPIRSLTPRDVTARPVGTFQLYGDTLTKFSPSCPNMVTHTSSMPKSEIQVRWTAPPPGSGCVIFRATVIEHRDVWYQDDGPLSKMLCEEVQESLDTQPEVLEHCCACDEAKYEVTFEGLWSRHTHPKDFPSNSWLTRFSDVIGASHSSYYRFWEYGGIASEGLRQVAERGSTRMLESELKSQSQNIRTIIKARGISYPNVTGKTFAVFRVDRVHHLMSLVSMIDPSPDWIVGVSALELCLRNCSWVESKVLNLYPWDAGTDSGVTYISPDQQTVPRDKIRRITSSFPNDPKSPFYDPSGTEMKPLARLYLTRQRLYEKTCEDEIMTDDPCALTEWGPWNSCSASCGPGYQYRVRNYIKKGRNKCQRPEKLSQRKYCMIQQCRVSPQPTEEPIDPKCEVSEWADWSRCEPVDNRCERGMQKRYRHVTARDTFRHKYCLSVKKVDERECSLSPSFSVCPKNKKDNPVVFPGAQGSTCCAGDGDNDNDGSDGDGIDDKGRQPDFDDYGNRIPDMPNETFENSIGNEVDENQPEDYKGSEEPTGECAMTQWSEWSPCSVTCGVGETKRIRKVLNRPEDSDGPRVEYLRAPRNKDEDYGTDDDLEGGAEGEDGGQGGEVDEGEYAEGACSIYKTQEVMACNGTYTCQFSEEDARVPEQEEEDGEEERQVEEENTEETSEGDPELYARSQLMVALPKCDLSEWADWSCCEHGTQKRYRHVIARDNFRVKDCLNVKKVDERECSLSDSFSSCANIEKDKPLMVDLSKCELSEWADWRRCEPVDNRCERGMQKRYRRVTIIRTNYELKHQEHKSQVRARANHELMSCLSVKKVDERECSLSDSFSACANIEKDNPSEEPTGECAMTQWSEWSPCSVTCGVGETRRIRQVLNHPEDRDGPRVEYLKAPRNSDEDYGIDMCQTEPEGDEVSDEDESDEGMPGGEGEYSESACSKYKTQEVMACNGTYTCQFSEMDAIEPEPEEEEEDPTEEAPEEHQDISARA